MSGQRRRLPTEPKQCPECFGTGLDDNHVTGETECSFCEGTGIDPNWIGRRFQQAKGKRLASLKRDYS